ncbi:MAG: selenocysteine-specific translation elongation factor [Spirochaetaceae bacterium]|jgi:selenocysteine-specific elongation factor|nr:selenocysteine-specific translation elongation factor [Spirochaetaceae bacterium]
MEYPFIVGTAGHIDHGKTALVRALTGVDCDRLEEEKRRGITIELGFAPLSLPDGKVVSIVDVPGHERFVRQMAAGASGMDAAMLVIAATEGVMPQTREHLDILNLLGVRSGLVALTKKDLADGEMLELAIEEAAELIRGTCLEGAAVIPVSTVSGEGIKEIAAEIAKILDAVPPRKGTGAFFLPVDRVFSKKGFGSVVTGTAYQGTISEGDEIEVLPSGEAGRVRSLQTHGTKVNSVQAGQRAAVNLSSVSAEGLERGNAVCAKGAFIATDCISAHLEVLPSAPAGIRHWQRVRLHVGTADVVARISLLKLTAEERNKGYPPGTGGPVQILPEEKIPAAAGQRFVVRLYSPLVTIGGGRIMLPNASLARGKADRASKAALTGQLSADFCPPAFLAAIVRDRGVISASGLAALSQMDKSAFTEALGIMSAEKEKYQLLEFGKARNFITDETFNNMARAAARTLQKFHAQYPELAGLDAEKLTSPLESVNGAAGINAGDFKDLLSMMAERKLISQIPVREKICYKAADFRPSVDAKFTMLVERVKNEAAAAGFNLIKLSELDIRLGVPSSEIKRAASYLREQGELWLIEGIFLFLRETRDKLLTALACMEDDITVAALRDAAGINRKLALSMLDFLDSQGLTRRDGDKRTLVKSG